MGACMCNVFGRSIWDDDFKQRFFADPLAACRVFDGPTGQASGLRALTKQDFGVLDQQIKAIRTTLGAEAMREIADSFGLQMILGRAMIDPAFAKRLEGDADGIVREFLGDAPSAHKAAAFLKSAPFKKLNGFAKHREAMREAGKNFAAGISFFREHGAKADSAHSPR
jgi:hypothetical protein